MLVQGNVVWSFQRDASLKETSRWLRPFVSELVLTRPTRFRNWWLVFQVVPYADFVAHRSALVFQYSISESPFRLDHVVFEYAEQVHWVSCLGVLRDLSYSSSGTYCHICFCATPELIQTYFPTRTIWCRLYIFVLYRNSTDVTYIVMRWRWYN